MHPFGQFLVVLDQGASANDDPRSRPVEPLPPIDEATLRAWRAWGRRVGMTDHPTLDRRAGQLVPSAPSAGQPADRPA